MALGAVQQIAIPGITPTFAQPGASETINPDPRMILWVKFTGSSTVVITAPPSLDRFGQTLPDISLTASSGERTLGPFVGDLADTTGLVTVTFGTPANVTAGWFRI